MSKWTFDNTVQLELPADFMTDLAELFDADADVTAVRLYWQWGGYDDSDHYGSYGVVVVDMPTYLPPKEMARQKPQLAALMWAFKENHDQQFRIFDEGSNGNSSVLIVTRDGLYFGLENSSAADDPHEAEWMLSNDDGKAQGLHIAEIAGHTSAHDLIAATIRFRDLFPKLCEALDKVSNGESLEGFE